MIIIIILIVAYTSYLAGQSDAEIKQLNKFKETLKKLNQEDENIEIQ